MSAMDKIRAFAESRSKDEEMLPDGSLSYGDARTLLESHWWLYRMVEDDTEKRIKTTEAEIAHLRHQRKVYRREIRRLQKALERAHHFQRAISQARLELALEKCVEALRWCSGASDFQEEGAAREGYEKAVAPVLLIASEVIRK
jgi:hypothetical protein